jgi:hypothetical protein
VKEGDLIVCDYFHNLSIFGVKVSNFTEMNQIVL